MTENSIEKSPLQNVFVFSANRDDQKEAMELAKKIVPLFKDKTLLQVQKAFDLALDSFKSGYVIQ